MIEISKLKLSKMCVNKITVELDNKNLIVYPMNNNSINYNIPDGIQPANYRIGKYINESYKVIYVGRVDSRNDRGLKDRMLEHLKEYTSDHYFEWNSAIDALDAYKTECEEYHIYYEHLDNEIHPRKPSYPNTYCPCCGE